MNRPSVRLDPHNGSFIASLWFDGGMDRAGECRQLEEIVKRIGAMNCAVRLVDSYLARRRPG